MIKAAIHPSPLHPRNKLLMKTPPQWTHRDTAISVGEK
jgi:hypothetical protein